MAKLFKTRSEREIKRIYPMVRKIEALHNHIAKQSDAWLLEQTAVFRHRYQSGESLNSLLPEAFAVVREASRRVLGMEHYPVQLLGGILLYQGRIAEMKTGEGKTLVAVLPSYLMALTGKGVHVVTVNDYLAQRDAHAMGQVHTFLGLSVGCAINDMDRDAKQAAYACDVTYVTNTALGFDYLRDNMVTDVSHRVLRGLSYAIIDEVDSILIDEARTPLIISNEIAGQSDMYERCCAFVHTLERGDDVKELTKHDIITGNTITETGDYLVYEKDNLVHLTAQGIQKAERVFGLSNYADESNMELQHHITIALKAKALMHRDKDYVVKDGAVCIVDEFTGRLMPGRRYSDGLHQAIEAKEHVSIQKESCTQATVTFQNFFNKYERKCGMTGTALTEEQEFRDIYSMDVVSVPTNQPVIREDLDDVVFLTKQAKYNAIVQAVSDAYQVGQPVLVGTVTIAVSERLSDMLHQKGIPHNVLNAKCHEQEAEIIAHAGEAYSVTIATNMAGRGTDIKLDEKAKALGGLFIIGTERHESRRIDNQLRGRAGRQGDAGKSCFYISLEDDVMRLFGSEKLLDTVRAMGVPENEALCHKFLSNGVESAQKKIEGNYFMIRKNLLDLDLVDNQQRELVYGERNRILSGADTGIMIYRIMQHVAEYLVGRYYKRSVVLGTCEMMDLFVAFDGITGRGFSMKEDTKANMIQCVTDAFSNSYQAHCREQAYTPDEVRQLERFVLLRSLDTHWVRHLESMTQLREGIGLLGYGQKDPVIEYKLQGFALFDEMLMQVQIEVLRLLYKSHRTTSEDA